jgi:hypothetical protein
MILIDKKGGPVHASKLTRTPSPRTTLNAKSKVLLW